MGLMKIWALRKVELRMGSFSIKCMAEDFTKHEASSFFFCFVYFGPLLDQKNHVCCHNDA